MASVSFRKRAVAFTAAAALSITAFNVLSDAARKNIANPDKKDLEFYDLCIWEPLFK